MADRLGFLQWQSYLTMARHARISNTAAGNRTVPLQVTALVLNALLQRLQCARAAGLQPGLFVGSGGGASSLGMNHKEQAKQMQRFHDGLFSVMLATGAAWERCFDYLILCRIVAVHTE